MSDKIDVIKLANIRKELQIIQKDSKWQFVNNGIEGINKEIQWLIINLNKDTNW